MSATMTPFLMFQKGEARPAIDFYLSVLPDARLDAMELFEAGEPGPEGTVKSAELTLAGQRLRLFDSYVAHDFGFTPAFSFFVDCEDEAQLRGIAQRLGEGGSDMMPVGNYGFSRLFAWVQDRFGVSWQLNLP